MKNCEQYAALCSSYVERDLAVEQLHSLESHLKICPSCQAMVKRMSHLRSRMKTITPIKPPADFETVLRARIQISKRIGSRRLFVLPDRLRLPVYSMVTAVFLFAIVTSYQYSQRSGGNLPADSGVMIENKRLGNDTAAQQRITFSLDRVTLPSQTRLSSQGLPIAQSGGEETSAKDALADSTQLTDPGKQKKHRILPVSYEF